MVLTESETDCLLFFHRIIIVLSSFESHIFFCFLLSLRHLPENKIFLNVCPLSLFELFRRIKIIDEYLSQGSSIFSRFNLLVKLNTMNHHFMTIYYIIHITFILGKYKNLCKLIIEI